jgi:AraC-like DNA-binding protein
VTKLVRASTLEGFAQIAQEQRVNASELLRAAGVPENALLDPDIKFRVEALAALLDLTVRKTGFVDLPFRLAAGRRASTWGAMGLLLTQQKDLRAALGIVIDYIHIHNEAARCSIHDYPGNSVFVIEYDLEPYSLKFDLGYGHELGVAIVVEVIRSILGKTWRPSAIYFRHEPKGDVRRYAAHLGIAPQFRSDRVGIEIGICDLNSPIGRHDPAMEDIARKLVVDALAGRRDNLVDDVLDAIGQSLPSGTASLERVSRIVGIGPRAIQRKLAAEGRSYASLLQDVRLRLADFYVNSTRRHLTEIAGLLGFSTLSSFSRWYAESHGVSAAEVRRRAGVLAH